MTTNSATGNLAQTKTDRARISRRESMQLSAAAFAGASLATLSASSAAAQGAPKAAQQTDRKSVV